MKNKDKIILDLCGGTGTWSRPYTEAGYDVRIITLPDYDILEGKTIEWCISLNPYGILSAPPCTEFAISGARWWREKDATRPELLLKAIEIVHSCLFIIEKTKPKFWALENPVGRLKKIVRELGEPKLIFQPCDYGDAYTKKTLLWGEFAFPKKNPVIPEFVIYKDGSKFSKNYGWKSQEERSITPVGFARAFFEANK